jgi:deoxyribose-phosphate aldolase
MTASVRRAVRLEHRLTHPSASLADLEAAAALAAQHELAAMIVAPWLVKAARRALGDTRVAVGSVIGFPDGTTVSSAKAFEAAAALDHGATQVDFVVNGGALASDRDELVFRDMVAVVDVAHSALAAAGVIVEAAPATDDLVRRACRLAERAGADYVVTGTGDAPIELTVERTRLLRESVGPRIGVKAAGRFTGAEQIDAAMAAGATRVSAALTADVAADACGAASAGAAR